MQVNVINGGAQAFKALLYKPHDEGVLNYIQNNIQSAAETLNGVADSFMSNVYNTYEYFNNSSLINASKALLHSIGGHVNQDMIYPVPYDQLGNSNLVMQRYIIANPEVNTMYNKNLLHGFEDTYYDYEPDNKGKERYDYKRVVDGLVQFEEDGSGYIEYHSIDDYEEELDHMDKISILETWANAELALARGIDPTSKDMDEL